jgi:hypothetical protein
VIGPQTEVSSTVQELLRERMADQGVGLKHGDRERRRSSLAVKLRGDAPLSIWRLTDDGYPLSANEVGAPSPARSHESSQTFRPAAAAPFRSDGFGADIRCRSTKLVRAAPAEPR